MPPAPDTADNHRADDDVQPDVFDMYTEDDQRRDQGGALNMHILYIYITVALLHIHLIFSHAFTHVTPPFISFLFLRTKHCASCVPTTVPSTTN
jgi:hypothetical protein